MKYFFLLIIISLYSFNLFAQVATNDSRCSKTNNQDIFENPTRIGNQSNKYSGQCIDSDRFRNAEVINNNEEEIQFANYQHQNSFWKATINKNSVIKAVYFQIVRFNVVSGITAAHTQMRFAFEEPEVLKLESQQRTETTFNSDLIISFEASRPEGVSYNFAHGAVDNYLSVARVVSGAQRLSESTENIIEQYELNISQEERMQLLINGIELSDSTKFNRFYNTIKPNCTTDLFDLIDALPSQQLKNPEPFLTVISNDPIAGPSIEGLKERNLLLTRFANLRDEVERGESKPPTDEPSTKNSLSLLADIEGFPYSLIFVSDGKIRNEQVLKSIKKMAYQVAPQLVQRLGASLMLAEDQASFSLLGALEELSPLLKTELEKLNDQLPSEDSQVSLFFAPWNGSGRTINVLKEIDVEARLPFETYEADFDDIDPLFEGLGRAVSIKGQSKESYSLLGMGIHLHLKKNDSQILMQVLGQLGPLVKKFDPIKETEQADLYSFNIPNFTRTPEQPMVLFNLQQSSKQNEANFNLEFGPFSGLIPQSKTFTTMGTLSVTPNSCTRRAMSTPFLEGEVAILGWLGKWKDVQFHVTKVDFDLKEQNARKVDVTLKTLGFVCLDNHEDAGEAFTEEAIKQISTLKENHTQKGSSLGLSILNSFLSNNEENVLSGLN